MRKTVLVLLGFLLLASACSGVDEAAVEVPLETAVTEPASDDPAMPVDDTAAVLPVFRPVYDPAADPAVYLHGLVVWVLETDDVDSPAPDETVEQAAASRRAAACYASQFVAVLGPERHADVAAVLAAQGLLNGVPLDVVTVAERDRLYIQAAPCVDAEFRQFLLGSVADDFLAVDTVSDEASQAKLAAAFTDCFETLLVDDRPIWWLLELSLFDSPAAEPQFLVALLSACSESFWQPMLAEQYVSVGFERDTAECVAASFVELLVDNPAVFSAIIGESDTGGTGPDVANPMMSEMFTIMSDCDVPDSVFLQ